MAPVVRLVLGRGTRREAHAAGRLCSRDGVAGRQVEQQRANLGADEVVGTRRPQRDHPRRGLPGDEVEDEVVVRTSGRPRRPSVPAKPRMHRGQLGGVPPSLLGRKRLETGPNRAERVGAAVALDEVGRPVGSGRACSPRTTRRCRPRRSGRGRRGRRPAGRVLMRGAPRSRGRARIRVDATGPRRPRRRSSAWSAPHRRSAAARAITESGWRWSTWSASSRACIGGVDAGRRPGRPEAAVVQQLVHLVLVLDAPVRGASAREPGRAGAPPGRRGRWCPGRLRSPSPT